MWWLPYVGALAAVAVTGPVCVKCFVGLHHSKAMFKITKEHERRKKEYQLRQAFSRIKRI